MLPLSPHSEIAKRNTKKDLFIAKKYNSCLSIFDLFKSLGKSSTKHFISFSIFFILGTSLFAQEAIEKKSLLYKQIDTTELSMVFYYPKDMETKDYPTIIFFFGGGWKKGNIEQFEPHAKYFSKRGMVTVLANYRVKKRHGTSPFESLKDAKSAIRFLRKNADSLNIDKNKIVAAGGSAGGQLAAACALTNGFEEENEDLSISAEPNALILFNPVIDNGPGGYGYERIGEKYCKFSPLHNLDKDAPPTLIFQGTNDKYIPIETIKYYKTIMDKVGNRCDLHIYEGQKHGFFNYSNKKYYRKTLNESDKFLSSLGYLEGEPLIKPID